MHLNTEYFESILYDLIEENTLACAAVLKIVNVSYTDKVPTLAVTTEKRPRLLVNLEFICTNCSCEADVKAVLLHEFLHVLLNHTVDFKIITPVLNIALDAVINAIIHRLAGTEYSGFFSRFYANETGVTKLLRPVGTNAEERNGNNSLRRIWVDLYAGKLVVDDILDIAEQLFISHYEELLLLGNHDDLKELWKRSNQGSVLSKAVQQSLQQMDGSGIWRDIQLPGVGLSLASINATEISGTYKQWERDAWRILKKSLTEDRNNRRSVSVDVEITLPVLTPSDRRAWIKSAWSPLLPNARSKSTTQRQASGQTAQVYLDVSGSMNRELNALIGLLWKLRQHIRSPFWAFSNTVEPAEIIKGQLKTQSSGGTDLNPVLEHILKTGSKQSIIITDGYVGGISPQLLEQVQSNHKVFGIVSREGVTGPLDTANIEYAQLGRYVS